MYRVANIKTFFDNMVLPYTVPKDIEVKIGEWYVINTKFGVDIGVAKTIMCEFDSNKLSIENKHPKNTGNIDIDDIEIDDKSILEDKEEHIPVTLEDNKIIRIAEEKEIEERKRFEKEEEEAYEMALKEIRELDLKMKLINVHFLLNRKKVVFNFTADNRVDFRTLVKNLASIFRTRIEMRQIGVRDAAKILGGYGVCGENCCCMRSNCHVNSIFLKMAKDQGFVVNSSKITGLCGRLMCCLAYENDYYIKERKKYPDTGSFVIDGKRKYRIHSINILKDEIYASDEQHHQKKFSYTAIKFINKNKDGVATYKFITKET